MGKKDHDRCPFLFPSADYGSPSSSPSSTTSSESEPSSPPPSYSCTNSTSRYSRRSSPSITSPFVYLSTTHSFSSTPAPASPSAADCGNHNYLANNNSITDEISVEGVFGGSNNIIKFMQDPKEDASLCLVPSHVASQGYDDRSTTTYLKKRGERHQESAKERKKKISQQGERTEQVKVWSGSCSDWVIDDGYSWRKYGQKFILGARFPRSYYRCGNRELQGCLAKKQVQRSDKEFSIAEVTYRGIHTCV